MQNCFFLCSLDNFLLKNAIVFILENQLENRAPLKKKSYFDLYFTLFSHQKKKSQNKQNKTKQNKNKQNKAKQKNKTKQNKKQKQKQNKKQKQKTKKTHKRNIPPAHILLT